MEYPACDSSDDQSEDSDEDKAGSKTGHGAINVECVVEPSWNCEDVKIRLIDSPETVAEPEEPTAE